VANPTACILSGVMMLRFIGEVEAADKIEKAVEAVLKEGKNLTCDLGGNTGTHEFAEVIIEKMKK